MVDSPVAKMLPNLQARHFPKSFHYGDTQLVIPERAPCWKIWWKCLLLKLMEMPLKGWGSLAPWWFFYRIFPAFPPNWLEKNPAGQLWQPRQPADRWTENTSWEQHTLNGEAGDGLTSRSTDDRPVCFLIFLDFLSFSRRWQFKYVVLFSPQSLEKWSNLTNMFQMGGSTNT